MRIKNISGLYLVIDPSMDHDKLLCKVKQALKGGTDILQIWNNWPPGTGQKDKEKLIQAVIKIANLYAVPVLINNDWQLLATTSLHGVHFDKIPVNFKQVKSSIKRKFIAGATCTNDLEVVDRAEKCGMDYISFCAMYPSPSVDSCEIVDPETVKAAREQTSMPIFLSGGITPQNLSGFEDLDFNGVAVISGILSSKSPRQNASAYKQVLTNSSVGK